MTTAQQFVRTALTQQGDPYVFGSEASPLDPDPDRFDCSELVEWTGKRTGVQPVLPDGAVNQWGHCRNHKTLISVADGIRTLGALLFMGPGTGSGRNAIHHVAISLGNGTTIEAKGKAYGVGVFSATRGFDFAGLIPGVSYHAGSVPQPPVVVPQYSRGDKGAHVDFMRALLNIVAPRRKGKLIKAKGPVDDAFIAAVAEFQEFCKRFSIMTTGNPGYFGKPTGLLGAHTQKALADWAVHDNK